MVVHARQSRGTARLRRLGPLWRWLCAGVQVLDQTETGDLKRAAPAAPGLDIPGPLLVGASTRPGDEARLLAAWSALPAPRPRLLVAPRHAARFDAVHRLLQADGRTVARRSRGDALDTDVVLLDTMGELAGVLHHADAAFIGGTFDPDIGGHAPTEATAAGVPAIAGPCRHANPAAWDEARVWDVDADATSALVAALQAGLAAGRQAASPPSARARETVAALPAPRVPPEAPARPWLWPAVPIVHAVAGHRRHRGSAPRVAPVPVVSIGGLTAGGTGKTPVTGWLAARLPGAWVLGRGYRRPGGGTDARIGRPGIPPTLPLGDELEMLRRRGIPVVSCPDRYRGAWLAA
ncbi:MAG: tetraacyldisaccharide 4'-kinase, partial [Myxococcota bacterium]|nr:tetraacyldisaccharide 4'-kinase [Myxococcota bacterium]